MRQIAKHRQKLAAIVIAASLLAGGATGIIGDTATESATDKEQLEDTLERLVRGGRIGPVKDLRLGAETELETRTEGTEDDSEKDEAEPKKRIARGGIWEDPIVIEM